MSEQENEIESTGNLVGGLIIWTLIAIVLIAAAIFGLSWSFWALAGWCVLLVLDVLQSRYRNTRMYVRFLSELWWLPI